MSTYPGISQQATGAWGTILHGDGTPAAGATVAITDLDSQVQVAILVSDANGKIRTNITRGDYSFAITTEREAIWIEKQSVTSTGFTVRLANDCEVVTGRVDSAHAGETQISFDRHGINTGDMFVTIARSDGSFRLCLPRAEYTVRLRGPTLATGVGFSVPSTAPLELRGHPANEVRTAAPISDAFPHALDDLIADIERTDAKVIGLGEATHGSAEFFTVRAQLTLELARRSQLRAILLEVDAVAAMELERYAMGEAVELAQAVTALQYWTIDTHEFWQFMRDLRDYNGSVAKDARIHVWGIDVQNTERAVALLLARASSLSLSHDDRELLKAIGPARAKAVKEFSTGRRAALDSLLRRLAVPLSPSEIDTQNAIAAQSLITQVGYMDGDTLGLYESRRDEGMARLTSFIIGRTAANRAALWAHVDHISMTAESGLSMGQRLAKDFASKYYAIGFYAYQGSSRAWDPAGKIGVISHQMTPAPPFTLEGTLLTASGNADIAWIPLSRLPKTLRTWLEIPRFVRELGAVYMGEARAMILLDIPAAFNAVVLIKHVHDSSPTPTGSRHSTSP